MRGAAIILAGMSVKKLRKRLLQKSDFRAALKRLRELEAQLVAPHTRLAVPFLFKAHGFFNSIKPMQSQVEIGELFQTALARKPKVIVEIGTCNGGTFYLWCQAAERDATIISIDLPEGEFGGGYPACRTDFYRAFAKEGQQVHLVRADSHARETMLQIEKLLAGKKIDLLFIDGDHTYAGVKQDFELYSPLVAKDGLIALHDIAPREDLPRIEVWKFWEELKQRRAGLREWFDNTPTGRRIGIGVVPAAS
jgi:predicted O-methyltransferase YrrM